MNKKIILTFSVLMLIILPVTMISAQSTATGRSRGSSAKFNLTITCNAPGATVSISGTSGRAPMTMQLNKGNYPITVSAPGYLPKTININLQSNQTINVNLEADKPSLTVTCNVNNARLEIGSVYKNNGSFNGNVPSTTILEKGKYSVTVSAPGYLSQTKQINLSSSTTLNFNLEAENYTLSVTSNVVNAKVIVRGSAINGTLNGNTTYNTVLPPGTYRVKVNAPGYFALEKTVQLGGNQSINFQLQPKTAKLTVVIPNDILNYTISNPAAQVMIYDNGRKVNGSNIQLTPGQHTIRIVSGSFAAQQTLNVKAGESYSFELNFGFSVIKN